MLNWLNYCLNYKTMKYLAFIGILVLFACAVSPSEREPLDRTVTPNFEYIELGYKHGEWSNNDYHVGKLIIDDCVYIIIEGYKETSLTHAGNCPNHNK